jgi:hypothetical protein
VGSEASAVFESDGVAVVELVVGLFAEQDAVGQAGGAAPAPGVGVVGDESLAGAVGAAGALAASAGLDALGASFVRFEGAFAPVTKVRRERSGVSASDACGRLPPSRSSRPSAVPTFTITYRAGHSIGVETVEADEARVEGRCVVLADWRLVIFTPRGVIVRRIALRDVRVDRACR